MAGQSAPRRSLAGIDSHATPLVLRLRRVYEGLMKVFGIGLNKTGTKTLGACLRRLGFRHMSYRADLLGLWRRRDLEPIFEEIDRFDSFEDWPYPVMYVELFERYGREAKFILTRRSSPQAWLDSIKRHSLRTNPSRHARLIIYQFEYPFGVEHFYLSTYAGEQAAIRKFFSERNALDQLCELCWEDGDGWPELCSFLGAEAPDEPLPHENDGRAPIDPTVFAANVEGVRRQYRLLNPDWDDETISRKVAEAIAGYSDLQHDPLFA
jgi:hypothetical protein